MKITVDHVGQFRDAFRSMGREDQFSYEGLEVLFDFIDGCNPDYELDVIELCCLYAESTPEEIADSYSINIDDMSEEEISEAVTDFLDNYSSVIGTTASGSIVYASNF